MDIPPETLRLYLGRIERNLRRCREYPRRTGRGARTLSDFLAPTRKIPHQIYKRDVGFLVMLIWHTKFGEGSGHPDLFQMDLPEHVPKGQFVWIALQRAIPSASSMRQICTALPYPVAITTYHRHVGSLAQVLKEGAPEAERFMGTILSLLQTTDYGGPR